MRLSIFRLTLTLAVALQLASLTPATADADTTIKLPGATVTGKLIKNARGQDVQVYRGIRYAEAPTGANRWKPSKLLKPKGAVDATAFGNICYTDTRYDKNPAFSQSEDCLFLNVYAPAGTTAKSNLPVMIWTHGGGDGGGGSWISGSGNRFDGRNLVGVAASHVLFVSFNYRLGLFGFLANAPLLDEGSGANAGLRDMQTAFQWVQQNIAAFGGNPKDITAVGHSAGAMMIGLQMLTDGGSQQLFQKAILESSAYPPAVQLMTVAEQDAYTATLAQGVGCSSTSGSMLACLRAKDAAKLVASGSKMDWRPAVDGKFLLDLPHRLIDAKKVSKIPTLLGSNTHDGFYSTVTSPVPTLTSDENSVFSQLYPDAAFPFTWALWAEVNADLVLVCPNEMLAETLASLSATFRYRFNQASLIASTRLTTPLAAHSGELPYVFNDTATFATNSDTDAKFATDTETQTLVANIQQFWTTFAKRGSPNKPSKLCDSGESPTTPAATLAWPQYDPTQKQQIVLQQTLAVETNGDYMPQHAARCAFWQSVNDRLANTGAYARAAVPNAP